MQKIIKEIITNEARLQSPFLTDSEENNKNHNENKCTWGIPEVTAIQ